MLSRTVILNLIKAQELGIEVIRYHEFLGNYMRKFHFCWCDWFSWEDIDNGLLAHVISGYAPSSYLIGDGTGKGVEDAEYFAFEACEYKRHFLAYAPDYAIMTNIDFDHPDYFKDLDDVLDAFGEMALRVKKAIDCMWG